MLKSVMAGEYTAPPAQGAHDGGDLWNDARRQRVAKKDVGIASEREYAFLDPGPSRVVQTHDRCPHLHRQIHNLDDLGGVGFRK